MLGPRADTCVVLEPFCPSLSCSLPLELGSILGGDWPKERFLSHRRGIVGQGFRELQLAEN